MHLSPLDSTLCPELPLRWLYVDFNSYFASVEQQRDPSLRGRPIAVVPVDSDATCAIAASYEAKAYGIKTGTPIYEARRLCPELICVLAHHDYYVETHQRIIEEVSRHIPVSQVCSIDEVACMLMDNERTHAQVAAIARSIKQGLAKNIGEYVRCSIGVAPNKFLAKIATDLQKPDGFTILDDTNLTDRLQALALKDIPGIGHNMEKRLWRAGVYDMTSLLALSKPHMRKIWGSVWGETMWYMLRGVEVPDMETHRSTIGHSHVLSPELRDPAKARDVARRLTLKAASRLRRMGYEASRFHLSARIEHGPRLEAQRRCYPAQDSLTFVHLLDAMWREIMQAARGHRIKKISVTLYGLTKAGARQPEMFDCLVDIDRQARTKAENMSKALDQINHRFGRDSALLGMLPSQGRSFSGTKIAFTRIPDMEEFSE